MLFAYDWRNSEVSRRLVDVTVLTDLPIRPKCLPNFTICAQSVYFSDNSNISANWFMPKRHSSFHSELRNVCTIENNGDILRKCVKHLTKVESIKIVKIVITIHGGTWVLSSHCTSRHFCSTLSCRRGFTHTLRLQIIFASGGLHSLKCFKISIH